jgi:hypothetical protein
MIDPATYDAMSAPRLVGLDLPADVLHEMYVGMHERLWGA